MSRESRWRARRALFDTPLRSMVTVLALAVSVALIVVVTSSTGSLPLGALVACGATALLLFAATQLAAHDMRSQRSAHEGTDD